MEMTPRERMLRVIRHEKPDRIPTDIWATPEVAERLERVYGDVRKRNEALGIDGVAHLAPTYVGPAIRDLGPDERVDYWGIGTRRVVYPTGTYWEQHRWPLAHAKTARELDAYPWPTPDWFDYSAIAKQAREARKLQLVECGYMAPFYFHNLLRGLEQSLVDPHEDLELARDIVGRISDFFYAHHRRIFESSDGAVDIAQVTDDYGSQTGPLIGLPTFRELYRPQLERFVGLCREFGVLVFHHDDGAMRPFLPDLVEIGIDVLNPVQWVCPGMDRAELKRDFGHRICFHGGIDNQRVLPFGTPDEVRAEVRAAIDTLASDGTGYILAPCHNIQAVTPLENIVAMYDEARVYGKVPC